ncbi:histone acetyltransferase subunit NuA4-domain-containing protein [Microdochium trichocladiopsis]|uniref:Chromatin modification-related protein EAF6 n=1 Tax=Microdochium trichocladiopsis TaxID=1682393 RepID=A0A9P9BQM0_9PEZI|nr:histone acetyltransferase subunit NuA4-domain-containing protein [Microdochium trichocladiopsis]KAH7035023.1 histone acetyltransferase subunit NuA4-domain-containing protein [Microdochium trichocladiopsis]
MANPPNNENIQPATRPGSNTAASGPGAGGGGPNAAPAAASADQLAAYEQSRKHLKQMLNRQADLKKQLAAHEASILQYETEYLESTPMGNIITGFDNYAKGTSSSVAAQRRRTGLIEQNRVFSRSSLSYNPLNPEASEANSTTSTPAATAGTPGSTFNGGATKDKSGPASEAASGTGASTPAGESSHKRNASSIGGGSKKSKKKSAAATPVATTAGDGGAGGDDDSEADARENKKARVSMGARK